MSFEFCWEHHECTRDCRVRDLRVLFCWQIARREGLRDPEECAECSYRRRWAEGEMSIREFVDRLDRRATPRQARKILVVDDEPNILYALEESVRGRGFECISACDGEEALIIARGVKPDLILTDVIMPRLNGYELCERLKGDPETNRIPVVMVTVKAAPLDRQQAERCGANGYITKPFQMRELEEIIERLVTPPPA